MGGERGGEVGHWVVLGDVAQGGVGLGCELVEGCLEVGYCVDGFCEGWSGHFGGGGGRRGLSLEVVEIVGTLF